MKINIYFFITHRLVSLTMRKFSDKRCRENQYTHILFNIFFYCAVYEICGKILKSRAGDRKKCRACALHAGHLSLQTYIQNV